MHNNLHNSAEYCVQELKKTLPLSKAKEAQIAVQREKVRKR